MRRAEVNIKIVTTLIILAVTLVILFPLISPMFSFMKGFTDGGVCGATSALSAARWTGPVCITIVQSPVSMACSKKNIVISEESITTTQSGTLKEQAIFRSRSVEEAASEVVVDELARCWETFGKGSYPLFTQARDNWVVNFNSAQNTVCHICSEISFQEGLDLSGSSVQQALNKQRSRSETYRKFMNSDNTLCKEELREGGQTCWSATEDYFTNKKNEARVSSIRPQLNTKTISQIDQLSPQKAYAVVIMREGMQRCDTTSNAAGTEDPKLTMFAYVIAHDELSTACDTIIT